MSKKYLTIYNLQREKDWVLKNAFDIIETREINAVWQLEFSIPQNDLDQQHCQPYWYVRYGDDGQLYRFTEQVKDNADNATVTYHCEHVIATLSDDLMFQGPYIKGNTGTYTSKVLQYILDMQTVQNWIIGTCQPRRQFEYSWENENLLAALFSVPNCFATPYMWTYDTTTYPWKVNLVDINEDADPDFYLMAKKNILRSEESSSNLEICTRLYGLGEGEGVNQLTIKSVNGGLPYIQSSPEKIAEYGIVSRIFVDRRYQYPETLKARMETLLHELETPSLKREFDIVDLYDISPDDMYKAEIGRICLLKDDDTKVYVTKTVKNWSVPGDMKITIATKATDISTSIADLADRQRIEQVYSQGASQDYAFNFSGNATAQFPLNGYVYFPEDLKYLNEVKMKVMLNPFRSFSKSKSANFDGGTISTETDGGTKRFKTDTDGGTKEFKTDTDGGTKEFKTETDGGTKEFKTETDGGTKGFKTETDGGTKGFKTETDGGTKGFKTETDGGTKGFKTETDGGTKGFKTETDGGKTGLETISGGKVDTETGEGGDQEGSTEIASGGGGISLSDVSITVNIDDTGDAQWKYGSDIVSDKTKVGADGGLVATSIGSTHNHTVWGYTGEVTPPESADYKHDHAINFTTDGGQYAGSHTHTVYESSWTDGHSHVVKRNDLKHNHTGSGTGSVSVNNTEAGQSGFSHSHNFKIKAHTHKFTAPDHTHKFDLPDHQHKFDLPDHQHKFDLPDHQHKFDLPDHQHIFDLPDHQHIFDLPDHQHIFDLPDHQHIFDLPDHKHIFDLPDHQHNMNIGQHSHDIEPGIFESGIPTKADVYIDGKRKFSVTNIDTEVDITQYLLKNGAVPRGQWINISVKPMDAAPNNMAFISVFGNVFAFIQSYTGGNF